MALLTDPTLADMAAVQRNFDALSRRLFSGTGTPENVIKAGPGAIYLREDGSVGSSFYVKRTSTDSASGWQAVA